MRVLVAGRLSRKRSDVDQTGLDSQERVAVRWAKDHGHTVVVVVADYKSGRAGLEARKNLKPWVTDPEKLAQYDAILALKVDRLTRGDREETAKLEQWARDNHKALLFTEADVRFPAEGNDGIRWDIYLRMAHQEWLNISERYKRMQDHKREIGSAVGRCPWGFSIEYGVNADGDKIKLFMPDEIGRRWVPAIYQAVIDGMSIRDIAAWLDRENVPTMNGRRWGESYVAQLVGNPVYYGQRRNAGNLETEALVEHSVWQAAQAALAARAKPGRSAVRRPKALLSPVCGNPECDATGEHPSPMYRVSDSRGHDCYWCAGRSPKEKGTRRRGCGNTVNLRWADEIAVEAMLSDQMNPYVTRKFISGDSKAEQIWRLRDQAAKAYTSGDKAKFHLLDAQAEEIEAQKPQKSYWQELITCDTCGQIDIENLAKCWASRHHVLTLGEHFASLDIDGMRTEFRKYQVIVSKAGVGITTKPLDSESRAERGALTNGYPIPTTSDAAAIGWEAFVKSP